MNEKVERAVQEGLALAASSRRPFQLAGEYIAVLRNTGEWSEDDLLAVQTQLIDRLVRNEIDKLAQGAKLP